MKITISEELIARTEPGPDGYLVSRIPGKQNIFLYLKRMISSAKMNEQYLQKLMKKSNILSEAGKVVEKLPGMLRSY